MSEDQRRADQRSRLKELIVLKFTSMKRFCEISGRDYDYFRNMLNRNPVSDRQMELIDSAYNDVMKLNDRVLDSEISSKERQDLNQAFADCGLSMNQLSSEIGIPRTSIRDLMTGSVAKKNNVYDALTEYFDL